MAGVGLGVIYDDSCEINILNYKSIELSYILVTCDMPNFSSDVCMSDLTYL